MTRQRLEELKRKPHGPDVDLLIQEVELCWKILGEIHWQSRLHCKIVDITSPHEIEQVMINRGMVAGGGV